MQHKKLINTRYTYKKKIDAQSLRRSLYGLQTNYLGDGRPLEEVYEISKECLDRSVARENEAA